MALLFNQFNIEAEILVHNHFTSKHRALYIAHEEGNLEKVNELYNQFAIINFLNISISKIHESNA